MKLWIIFLLGVLLQPLALFAAAPTITSSLTMLDLNKLIASDTVAEDRYGISVAISGDTAIVGAYGDDCANGDDSCGSATIFERDLTTGLFVESATLTASDGMTEDQFGHSVAISGDTVIVGAFYDDTAIGSAYIFEKPSGGWSGNLIQKAKLTASDRAAGDEFGDSVAISGDVVIVGAHGDSSAAGSAYLFEKPPGGWSDIITQKAKLTASDPTAGDRFGVSVAVSGDIVIVGAYYDDNSAGSAYLFEKPSSEWANMTSSIKLTASDTAAGDRFGKSVAISADTVIVGAYFDDETYDKSGSAYLFEKPASGGWISTTEEAKLTASDGTASDYFGASVAISGDMLIVGAYTDKVTGTGSGSAYFFQKPASGWADATQSGKLIASDGASYNWFGASVAISGKTAIAGAYGNNSYSGAAYLFETALTQNSIENKTEILDIEVSDAEGDTITFAIVEGADAARFNINAVSGILSFKTAPDFESPIDADGDNIYEAILELSDASESDTFKLVIKVSDLEYEGEAPKALSFKELHKIAASDNATSGKFGVSVAISSSIAIIGAQGTGTAYIYEYQSNSDTFIQQARLSASDATGIYFGSSVAIRGDIVIVGAIGDYCVNSDPMCGSAYLFEKPPGGWGGDITENAKLTASDGASYDYFGNSVAIGTDMVIVTAYLTECIDGSNQCGSVYLFEKPDSGEWANATESGRLIVSDSEGFAYFGTSVAISGDTVIVGAFKDDKTVTEQGPGSAYLFEKPTSGWGTNTESAKLTASDGAPDDNFGKSVAISGDTVIVGAETVDDGALNTGLVYLYEKPALGAWRSATESAKLKASDSYERDNFGSSVAISGDMVIVGAYFDDCADDSIDCGSAYLFEKPASGWVSATETIKLTTSDGAPSDNFAFSVAISGDTAIVGAYKDDDAAMDSGSAYIFKVKAQGVNPGVIMYLLN